MKKIIFYTACATLALCSCTSSENTENGYQPELLTFSTYVNMNSTPDSRALDKSSFATNDVIGINACQTSGPLNENFTNNFMTNEALTKTEEGRWTYENSKFWPVNTTDRISFVATYPKIAPAISEGKCSFDFTVKSNANAQEDFMWSTITDAHRSDRNGTYQNGIFESPATTPISNVTLHFKHALSRIVFNAKAAAYYNGTTITVTDIILNNLYGAGTYTLSATLGKGSWNMSGEQNQEYIALENGTNTAIDTKLRTFGSSLLMIPQVLNTIGNEKSTVTIKYTVKYVAPAMTVNEERTFDLATVKLLNGNTWEQNKIYNYNFNIALDMITFDTVIDNWGGTEDSDLTID